MLSSLTPCFAGPDALQLSVSPTNLVISSGEEPAFSVTLKNITDHYHLILQEPYRAGWYGAWVYRGTNRLVLPCGIGDPPLVSDASYTRLDSGETITQSVVRVEQSFGALAPGRYQVRLHASSALVKNSHEDYMSEPITLEIRK